MMTAPTPSEYQLIGLTEGGDAGDIRAAIDADPQAVRAWLVQSIAPIAPAAGSCRWAKRGTSSAAREDKTVNRIPCR